MPIEVAALRPVFSDWLGTLGQRPNLVIRFGRAPTMLVSVRRPRDSAIAA
jgi:hypothetical protein